MTGETVRQLFAEIEPLRGIIEAGLHQGLAVCPVDVAWAALPVGDFLILAGEPEERASREALRRLIAAHRGSPLLVYAPGVWQRVLEDAGVSFRMETRWAFDHAVQPEDAHLQRILADFPAEAGFIPIEGEWFAWCRRQGWSLDFVSQFPSEEAFRQEAAGVLVSVKGEIVAGASAYQAYPGGIEVQVETQQAHQGRGYATFAAAKLILTAHARGLKATWDAASEVSAHLAEKLGYRCTFAYEVCMVENSV